MSGRITGIKELFELLTGIKVSPPQADFFYVFTVETHQIHYKNYNIDRKILKIFRLRRGISQLNFPYNHLVLTFVKVHVVSTLCFYNVTYFYTFLTKVVPFVSRFTFIFYAKVVPFA